MLAIGRLAALASLRDRRLLAVSMCMQGGWEAVVLPVFYLYMYSLRASVNWSMRESDRGEVVRRVGVSVTTSIQANVPHCDSELEGHDVLSANRRIASHLRKLGARSLRFMHRRAAAARPADTAGRACCLEL